jgi:single-strand DNA-binding protein
MNNIKNRIQLIGFIGKDAEIKVLDNGNKLARFSMATNETYKNAKGEKIDETTWHNIIAWGPMADLVAKIVKKGSEIVVDGKIVNRNYTDSAGIKKYITEIQLNELLLLGKKEQARLTA